MHGKPPDPPPIAGSQALRAGSSLRKHPLPNAKECPTAFWTRMRTLSETGHPVDPVSFKPAPEPSVAIRWASPLQSLGLDPASPALVAGLPSPAPGRERCAGCLKMMKIAKNWLIAAIPSKTHVTKAHPQQRVHQSNHGSAGR